MAIIGIGLDLIELSRMERSLHRFGEHFLNRIMADDERSAIPGDPASPSARAVSHVAARFAAKEAAVKALTGGRGTDAAVEVTGVAAAVEEGLHHLAPMGRYMIIGTNTLSAQATLSPGYITRKSLTVTGVARYLPEYLHKSLVFLDKFQHKYPFDNFSSMTFDLNDLEKGLEMVANRKVIRAVVESGDESNA